MREALERDEGRVALVTPDGALVRQVTAVLRRWDLTPDDSSGPPLSLTPRGVFAKMAADFCCRPFSTVALLALLKHPVMAGEERADHLRAVSRLERRGLRKRKVALRLGSVAAIEAAERETPDGGKAPLAAEPLRSALAWLRPWEGKKPLAEMIADHRAALEALAGPGIWKKNDGEALLAAFESFAEAAVQSGFGAAAPGDYPALFHAALMDGGEVRPEGWAAHPRLRIWGTLEARSQTAETVILGGLREGVWPALPKADPWLSRPMRAKIGLPPPELRIGLAAHDFLQCASARRVVMTRPLRAEGAPAAPSRWLSRLTALLSAVDGGAPLAQMRARGARWTRLAQKLARPDFTIPPAPRPAPRPALAARPRSLSVTQIETLIRDPYSVYARNILGLRPLDEPGAPADQRDRGEVLHEVAERFVNAVKDKWPGAAAAARIYERIVDEVLNASVASSVQAIIWRGRLERVKANFIEAEENRRQTARPAALEAQSSVSFATRGGSFTLTGRADRIDLMDDGKVAIYDYKSASAPSKDQVKVFEKQLPLLAMISERAGFDPVGRAAAGLIAYLSFQGDGERLHTPEEKKRFEIEANALDGLISLLNAFEDEDQPYLPRAYPEEMKYSSDYDHLSRYGEWEDRAPDAPPPGRGN